MTDAITFNSVSYANYFENISFNITAGSSTLILTSRIDENTSLFQLICGIIKPQQGFVSIQGQDISDLATVQLNSLRHSIGVVPANGGLISNLKMWENICLPLLYNNGTISQETTDEAYGYLTRLKYTGNIMALPAHLSTYEKRISAFIRGALKQSRIMIYSNCFDAMNETSRKNFISVINEFHHSSPGRTSLFISSSAEIASDLQIDTTISIH